MKKIALIILLGSVFLNTSYYTVFARLVDCIATTSPPIFPYHQFITLSSSTNAMIGSGFPSPTYIGCSTSNSGYGYNINVTTQAACTGSGNLTLLSFATSTSQPVNTHVEDPSLSNYSNVLCLSIYSQWISYAAIATQANNCNGYGTTLFSAPPSFNTTGNSHIGAPNAYPLKRCLTLLTAQTISVTYSSNTAGFGTLSPSATTYALTNGLGTTTPLSGTSSSFFADVSMNGNSGYSVYLSGSTLTNQQSPTNTITKIGPTPSTLVPGTSQFGVSVVAECLSSSCNFNNSSSSVAYPYNSNLYAYDGGTSSSTLIANGIADDTTLAFKGTRYNIKLAANIPSTTPAGNYTTNLVLTVTAQF